MLQNNIVITKEIFDDFRKTKFDSEEQRLTAGSNLVEFLQKESKGSLADSLLKTKAAGTQLVKNEAFQESNSMGWAKGGRAFYRVDDIRKELTPAFYVGTLTMSGPILIPFQVTNDDILDLPGEKTESILKAIREFHENKETFKALNFLHKRGMILKGQPGTGKSIVAFKAGRDLIQQHAGLVMYATDPYSMEACARDIREVQPTTDILNTIEDIDMMVAMYGERKLTAFLDGESSIGGIFTLGITNDDRILSSRIMSRPSRFDVIETVGVMSKAARISFLQQKATSLTPEQIETWADKTEDYTVPMLKELMIMVLAYMYSLDDSIARINKTFKSRITDV
jgi:hypothetical protein